MLVFGCPEHHVICIPCFRDYCISRLNDRSFTLHAELGYTLGCPVGCENSFICASSKHFAAVLHEDPNSTNHSSEYNRYQRFAVEEYVLQSGGVLCPQPNCGTGIMPQSLMNADSSEDLSSTIPRKVVCTECRYVFCRLCLQGYHVGDCNETHTNNTTEGGYGVNQMPLRQIFSVNDRNLVSRARWDPEGIRAQMNEVDDLSASMTSWVAIRITTKPCPKVRHK